MCLFGIFNIVLLSWCYQAGGTELELSPKIVFELLSLRIDNVILETHNLKSELTETKTSVERIEQKIEKIDANMALMTSKAEKSEKEKLLSFLTDAVKVKQDSSMHFIQENFKTQTILLRKMLVNEKSHLRKRVLTFENKFKKLQSEIVKHLTLMNDSMESKINNLEHSMTEHRIVVDNRLTFAENEIQHYFNETDTSIQEMTASFENKLTDSDAKVKQFEVVFTGNISKLSQRVSTINSDLKIIKSGFNGRLDNSGSQHRTMLSKLAKCSLVGHPSNQFTRYKDPDTTAHISTYALIDSRQRIEVFCDNQYELYVNDSKKYMDKSFITRCRKGKFNNDKFPVCVEKRCSFNAVEACFFEDDDRKCKRDDFKIQSGSSINIKCDTGYQLSVSEETLEGQGSINCNKGRYPSFKCIPGVFYIISAKTGSRRYAGTDAKVYITLFGAGGSTRKIYFEGSFERNDVDEIRIMAKDIRPIKNVQIGHDGSGKSSSWYIDYVSIYVENMEEFYSFRNEEKHWVKGEIDLTLLNREMTAA